MAAARKAAMSLMAEMDSDDDAPAPAKPQEEAKPAGDVEAAMAKLSTGDERWPKGHQCCNRIVHVACEGFAGHASSWFVGLPTPDSAL